MAKMHEYQTSLVWTGNKGSGTMDYRLYDRSYVISVDHKADIQGSSDSAFMGDKSKHNPEDLLVSSISSCHMLWYLHLCSQNGIIVLDYKDRAVGVMEENADGSGRFTSVVLNPEVTINKEGNVDQANALHAQAHKMCFIANSCNFPITHQPKCIVERS
ncbi:OsmC family protein [Pedobacter frigoris]|uniref:OsmC family peroxiredoxin n=1 Tax=Pedobacter frigoris TaxID=2571272 RepID=A0A4U1CNT1_9SPHI|nr:OsmC family protein [Pedobacter frigoris]TKC09113.1 OsmC family peroxiredoxin [Pedobacter frigoris]